MSNGHVTANGKSLEGEFPCPLNTFLERQGLLPKSVVVELNGMAVTPSEFEQKKVVSGDCLEIVRIVAGG
ncbi:sulfur carrier protein ThiS [bacterium]|nr:sulfur carrier protein ThiS [bacterium]